MTDEDLKKLREKYGPSYGWTSGAAEDRAEVVTIIEEALSRGAQRDEADAHIAEAQEMLAELGVEWVGGDGSVTHGIGRLIECRALGLEAQRERDEARAALNNARAVAAEEAAELAREHFAGRGSGHLVEELRALSSSPPSGQWVAVDVMERVKAAGAQLFACIEGGWAMDGSPIGRAKWADARANLRAALSALESEASR